MLPSEVAKRTRVPTSPCRPKFFFSLITVGFEFAGTVTSLIGFTTVGNVASWANSEGEATQHKANAMVQRGRREKGVIGRYCGRNSSKVNGTISGLRRQKPVLFAARNCGQKTTLHGLYQKWDNLAENNGTARRALLLLWADGTLRLSGELPARSTRAKPSRLLPARVPRRALPPSGRVRGLNLSAAPPPHLRGC